MKSFPQISHPNSHQEVKTIFNANISFNDIFSTKYSNILNLTPNLNFYLNAQYYFKCYS